MSSYMAFPAQGIRCLIIEEMARDAHIRGTSEETDVQVLYQAGGHGDQPGFLVEGDCLRFRGTAAVRVVVPARVAVAVECAVGELDAQELTGDLSLQSVHGDLQLRGIVGRVRVGQANGDLRAEAVAYLAISDGCHGDLRYHDGEGLEAETIMGDLRLVNVRTACLGRVHGDIWAERLSDGLQVGRADGDVRLNEISGPVVLQAVAGDLRAGRLAGGLTAPEVAGDADLSGPFAADQSYTVTANGDVNLHLETSAPDEPADTDARLAVKAAGRIRSDPLLTPAADGSPVFTATLGRGSARITITSRGDLHISQAGSQAGARTTSSGMGLSDLGDRIRQQVTASLAAAGINIETGEVSGTTRSRRPPMDMGCWGGFQYGRRPKAQKPPRPSAPERPRMPSPPPASTDEQMAILQMVEAGTVTAEEAEMLLRALGGC